MPTELITRPTRETVRHRGPGSPGRAGFGGNGHGRDARPAATPAADNATLFLSFGMAGIVMLFVAFTTTYLGHRQDGTWTPLPLPRVLWVDTVLLLAASGAMEWARRQLRRGDRRGLADGLTLAAALGAAFLVGQITAWRVLDRQGVFLSGAPHSSFFYLLTGAHGVHLLAGLAALAFIAPRAWRGVYAPPAATAVRLAALYWHFLTALWLYLFAILFWL